ncbi:MAG TPA: S-adenosylmethionine:tRNA ribosyltransferase-isomerase, partial [Candidatus Binatia bacterium]|nr:S-adenosylmethionine:tRNA ribosyltransferase-isomerase [Candidatus Binatia bacterium]
MLLSDFDYDLPPDLIAQEPAPERASSRLLVVDCRSGRLSHSHFSDLLHLLPADCLLVLNDTRVFPARLRGRKESGGAVEVLLLHRVAGGGETWEVLCKGAQGMRAGSRLWFAPEFSAEWRDTPRAGRGVLRFFSREDLPGLL